MRQQIQNRGAVLHGPEDLRFEPVSNEPVGPGELRIKLGAAGICGSDQHYYRHARMGRFVLKSPFVLGHEMSGDVIEVGSEIAGFALGDRVVVDPALTCGTCPSCRAGRANLCYNVQFMGSASHDPHLDGGYRDSFVVNATRCVKVPRDTPHEIIAATEPLSVAVHAIERAGPLLGRDVLITGGGTIGCLTVACAAVAGAARICVSDPNEFRRETALKMGASDVIDPLKRESVNDIDASGGAFDLGFEVSGNTSAFDDCVRMVRRGGRAILVGMIPTGNCYVPFDHMTIREIDLIPTFRQNGVFERAAKMLVEGRVDPRPIVTGRYELLRVKEAFAASFHTDRHIKVLLHGSGS
ncbi:alcohol dehydrogenase catalytic domain-containing protein [Notoacmeibacter marinus]|uniref:alcohol dehydrogenase catalytic domain-containing protein n=1 Tax=Notoacmeibacter marinus TaxID=1876515 RepID=UPI000DF29110|nr:alcohol dehydrogenase catalytic domain-containing protein [Notoacmeibacter marinus]